jgi:hypothetical protein
MSVITVKIPLKIIKHRGTFLINTFNLLILILKLKSIFFYLTVILLYTTPVTSSRSYILVVCKCIIAV